MPEYYDALETRDAAVREREQFARLSAIIARAMSAPGWSKHLAGIDPKSVTSRAALAKLPVLHKSDICGVAEAESAVRRSQRDRAWQSPAFADVSGVNL